MEIKFDCKEKEMIIKNLLTILIEIIRSRNEIENSKFADTQFIDELNIEIKKYKELISFISINFKYVNISDDDVIKLISSCWVTIIKQEQRIRKITNNKIFYNNKEKEIKSMRYEIDSCFKLLEKVRGE